MYAVITIYTEPYTANGMLDQGQNLTEPTLFIADASLPLAEEE